jgi:hypothetical protein
MCVSGVFSPNTCLVVGPDRPMGVLPHLRSPVGIAEVVDGVAVPPAGGVDPGCCYSVGCPLR